MYWVMPIRAQTFLLTIMILLVHCIHLYRYEQGVRAKVSEELGELRGQQKEFCDNLEQLMENAAEEEEEDEREQQQ